VRVAPVLAAVVVTVLILWMLGVTAQVFLLLFISVILSLYLGAVTDFFVTRGRIPRRPAFVLALLVSVAGIGGFIALLIPPIVDQTGQLIRVLPEYVVSWEQSLDRFVARFPAGAEFWRPGEHRIFRAIYEEISAAFTDVVPKVVSIVHGFISIFAVAVMSIYLTLQPGVYREWLIALFPPVHRELVRDVLRELADTLRAYITGMLFAMFVLAVLTAVGLYVLEVPYWLTFGVFTGLVAVVPFFGTLVSTLVPAAFVLGGDGFAGFGPGMHAVLVILLGVVVHLFEGNVIHPLVMQRKVELPPVLTIMAVLVFGLLLGPIGLIVAVPALATLMVIVRRIVINRIYEGKGFRRATRDRTLLLQVPVPEGGVLLPANGEVDVIAAREAIARAGGTGEHVPGDAAPLRR
jgi:predicted PurR-regulated permease PerM